jgi:hypothetical protein
MHRDLCMGTPELREGWGAAVFVKGRRDFPLSGSGIVGAGFAEIQLEGHLAVAT